MAQIFIHTPGGGQLVLEEDDFSHWQSSGWIPEGSSYWMEGMADWIPIESGTVLAAASASPLVSSGQDGKSATDGHTSISPSGRPSLIGRLPGMADFTPPTPTAPPPLPKRFFDNVSSPSVTSAGLGAANSYHLKHGLAKIAKLLNILLLIGLAAIGLELAVCLLYYFGFLGSGKPDGLLMAMSLDALIFVITAVVFLLWTHEVAENAHALVPHAQINSVAMATVSYFIPLANLFWPFLIMSEILRISIDPSQWRRVTKGSGLLFLWWFLWVVSWFLMLTPFNIVNSGGRIDDELWAGISLISCGANIPLYLMTIWLVRTISRNQRRLAGLE